VVVVVTGSRHTESVQLWCPLIPVDDNNNNNIYLLQLGCYPAAVVILHLH